ncbi:hypothetical protein APHAL10511_006780 [Amanita phalloides]|nr:hypothetical protein APHAL10511_006780 [Amanita phalloides]
MRYPLPLQYTAVLFLLPLAVLSCEKECQTGIAQAYASNYSYPVHQVMSSIANEMASTILPQQDYPLTKTPIEYVATYLVNFHKNAPLAIQTAIFNKFHGKCQRDEYAPNGTVSKNIEPHGCPNPDCPVVCGTPGSLHHYFELVTRIVFKATTNLMQNMAAPESDTYKEIEKGMGGGAKSRQEMRRLFDSIPERMQKQCDGEGKRGEFGECRWAQAMKEYILSFP